MKNCWEYTNCQREPGGANTHELGICPASQAEHLDGINRGQNGGRICWSITASLCGGKIQGSLAAKYLECRKCQFYNMVLEQEGEQNFVFTADKICTGKNQSEFKENGAVITLVHRQDGKVEDAHRIANTIKSFIEKQQDGGAVGILHDARKLQTAGNDYRDVFVELEKSFTRIRVITAAVIPNVMMRLLAKTLNLITGNHWHYLGTISEAEQFLAQSLSKQATN